MAARGITETVAVEITCDRKGCPGAVIVGKYADIEHDATVWYRADEKAESLGWTAWNSGTGRPYRRDYCKTHTPTKPPAHLRRIY